MTQPFNGQNAPTEPYYSNHQGGMPPYQNPYPQNNGGNFPPVAPIGTDVDKRRNNREIAQNVDRINELYQQIGEAYFYAKLRGENCNERERMQTIYSLTQHNQMKMQQNAQIDMQYGRDPRESMQIPKRSIRSRSSSVGRSKQINLKKIKSSHLELLSTIFLVVLLSTFVLPTVFGASAQTVAEQIAESTFLLDGEKMISLFVPELIQVTMENEGVSGADEFTYKMEKELLSYMEKFCDRLGFDVTKLKSYLSVKAIETEALSETDIRKFETEAKDEYYDCVGEVRNFDFSDAMEITVEIHVKSLNPDEEDLVDTHDVELVKYKGRWYAWPL